MNKKNTVLVLGIFAIIVLIAAQIIIIKGVWQQKDEMLSLRYRSISQEAVRTIFGRRSAYDTVRFLLNDYSGPAVKELENITDEKALAEKKKEIYD